MAAEGLATRFPMHELAVMGLAEVLPRLPRLLRRVAETAAYVKTERPDAIVTIDAPSFGLRVTEKLQGLGIARIHYVAPQLWAWRPGRARRLRQRTDCLLALLPFEPEFFAAYDIPCRFVGHPAVERVAAVCEKTDAIRRRLGLVGEKPVLVMLPGSRQGEVKRLLPVFCSVAENLMDEWGGLTVLVPTVSNVVEDVRHQLDGWSVPHRVLDGGVDRLASFRVADVALAASGTVTLELALSGTPMAVAYRANPLTAALVRRLIKVRHVAIPNILLGREVVPEFIQEDCQPDKITAGLAKLLANKNVRDQQVDDLAQISGLLGAGGLRPSLRAANAVLEMINDRCTQLSRN